MSAWPCIGQCETMTAGPCDECRKRRTQSASGYVHYASEQPKGQRLAPVLKPNRAMRRAARKVRR